MEGAVEALDASRVPHEVRVVSAHRTPDDMLAFGHEAAGRGLRVIIAGAGGAAHLPGMLASVTTLPVIGVPVALATSTASTRCSRSSRCPGRPGGHGRRQRRPQRRPARRPDSGAADPALASEMAAYRVQTRSWPDRRPERQ